MVPFNTRIKKVDFYGQVPVIDQMKEGYMSLLILALIIIVLVAAFSVQNAAPVTISLLFWKFQASLAIVTFLSVLIGAVIATIIAVWFSLRKPKKEDK